MLIATGFGAGFVPVMPGTVASLLAALVWWLFCAQWDLLQEFIGFLVLLGIGIVALFRVQKIHPLTDQSEITIDELIGQVLALVFLPAKIWCFVLAFALFRLFDIWKPGPIGVVDRGDSGVVSIILDDCLSGIFAGGIVLGIHYGVNLYFGF